MPAPLPSVRRAFEHERGAIRVLLDEAALPTADLEAAASALRFWVAEDDGQIVGVAGLEGSGESALLRSLAVSPAWQGRGLGRALVERIEVDAMAAGTAQLALLTDTARGFFEQLGYEVIERSDAPVAVTTSAQFATLCPASAACLLKALPTVIYHNPNCGTSRNVLALLREAGIEPRIVEYLQSPPDRQTLETLIARMHITPRELLRQKGTPYNELGLGADHWTDAQLIEHMLAQPVLINRPIVVTPRAAQLCRPSQTVEKLLAPGGA